ncbi:MAG: DUF2628 domain-containing protein [Hydrogenophaga sp.]|uniref:SPOR domain-containing protein n=1 Tax=Hydrogenophaga sp. TaxID=1904254 RepID=UPI0016B15CC0|nr:SPOR domain-containing protein [Hydrogenophaga sp.]NIM41575.1 DUF2628 domain-containing protein [Hydrogenophaga sp.]NIN26883.1 DUF2628 domain-containing protein [Hydrogenophaga sp.]NIN31584.1 DUF2628 domain-containing protein [Hydrogenophaga sp.]NIN55817.1 DUF2628 domain-containing protein [Hydrogenophaga sp.]NIO51985.1 DUF2628 domain-containing protein [Hydrogenophaga sp.]
MTSPPTVTPPDTAALTSATEALYRAALGPGRTAHYLPVFARFDERGMAGTSWNHAAAWLNLNWLLYRRLWRRALLYAVALAAALGLWWWARGVMAAWPAGVRWGLLALIGVLAVVVPGWWGSAWLHADVRRRMTDAVRRARTVQEACGLLQRVGPLRWAWALALVVQMALLFALGVRTGGGAPTTASGPALAEPTVAEAAAPAPVPAALPAPVPASASASPASGEPVAEPAPSLVSASSGGASVAGTVTDAPPRPPVAAPAPPPILAPATRTSPRPAEASVASADAPRPRWQGHGVNVGIFADPANAERAAARLRQAGLPVRTDPVESARGPLTRVRVGPFDTHDQAVTAAETVRNLGLEARVFGP